MKYGGIGLHSNNGVVNVLDEEDRVTVTDFHCPKQVVRRYRLSTRFGHQLSPEQSSGVIIIYKLLSLTALKSIRGAFFCKFLRFCNLLCGHILCQ